MNARIKSAIESGRIVLVFGAGASIGSTNQTGDPILSGTDLSKLLAKEAQVEYSGEGLQVVYGAVKHILGGRLNTILEMNYRYCEPSDNYIVISKFPWARIYTLNIDDALDRALARHSSQKINTIYRFDKIIDQDKIFNNLEYVKINGSIDRMQDGLIFSEREYGKASAVSPLWYRELAEDFFKYTILFIGTKLDESTLWHHIERYKLNTNSENQRSYVITPSATVIQKNNLLNEHNIEHISGKFEDFTKWLTENFPSVPSVIEVAIKSNPQLGVMFGIVDKDDKSKYSDLFSGVLKVDRKTLGTDSSSGINSSSIKLFYKGFKPTWDDIINEIPATMEDTTAFFCMAEEGISNRRKLISLFGPAGSGKTTLLKQVSLMLSDTHTNNIFYLEGVPDDIKNLVRELERTNTDTYVVFTDRLDLVAKDLLFVIENNILSKGLFIGSSSENVWERWLKDRLGDKVDSFYKLSQISKNDAILILDKLEKYGPWTRLAKLRKHERIDELIVKSKRQLLIGLLETTSGSGYEEIIEKDYNDIQSDTEKEFLTIVGLTTMHRLYLSDTLAKRALSSIGVLDSVDELSKKLSGIVHYSGRNLYARHHVYIRYLMEQIISQELIHKSLRALLNSFSVYQSPLIKSLNKSDHILFKTLTNHQFLNQIFRKSKDIILAIYADYEKFFENDAFYWLQYGLALRDFGLHDEAFDKLNTAFLAHPQFQIEHALAQQELIIALNIDSKTKSYALLDRAKERLDRLDHEYNKFDSYPIVTLSKFHSLIVKKHGDINEAQSVAARYADIIHKRIISNNDSRLKETWSLLANFVKNGKWEDLHKDSIDYLI
jgi:GTPase SAR1 family protein